MAKEYDYLLKVLLVGDSDVGKTEILNNLEDALDEDCRRKKNVICLNSHISLPFLATYKTTIILLDGKRVKLQVSAMKFSIFVARNFANCFWVSFLMHFLFFISSQRFGMRAGKVASAQ